MEPAPALCAIRLGPPEHLEDRLLRNRLVTGPRLRGPGAVRDIGLARIALFRTAFRRQPNGAVLAVVPVGWQVRGPVQAAAELRLPTELSQP